MDYLFANFLSPQANRREDRYGANSTHQPENGYSQLNQV